MHPSLRLGLLAGAPIIGAIFVVISWRFYRRWRGKPALTSSAAPPAIEPKTEPKEESPIRDSPIDLKEVTTVSVSLKTTPQGESKEQSPVIIVNPPEGTNEVSSILSLYTYMLYNCSYLQ